METTTAKVWTIDEIKNLLETNKLFVCRAIVKIFERQTEDEKVSDQTAHNNGIGFNGTDAFILSKFAKFYIERGFLSEKQFALGHKRIKKYAKQLTKIANEAFYNKEALSQANHDNKVLKMEQGL